MEKGGIALVSDEDIEVAQGFPWREFRLKPSGRLTAWCPQQANGRRFDLFLHRLIAVRINPDLAKRKFAVTPASGDYFDCRRENLEIAIHKRKRQGLPPKPGGHPLPGTRRSRPKPCRADGDLALLWNPGKYLPTTRKLKSRRGAVGDGPAGRALDGDPR